LSSKSDRRSFLATSPSLSKKLMRSIQKESCHHPFYTCFSFSCLLSCSSLQIMFRRQLLRQSRAITNSLSTPFSSAQRATFVHASSASLRSIRPSSASLPQLIQQRWQSTTAESKETSDGGEAKPEDAPKEDPSKAELEKKNKEIVDLKVRSLWMLLETYHQMGLTNTIGQIP
jgi:hypothetical protein